MVNWYGSSRSNYFCVKDHERPGGDSLTRRRLPQGGSHLSRSGERDLPGCTFKKVTQVVILIIK